MRQAESAAKSAKDKKAAEDRALKASQELLAEEEQQHAQAAVKKAKKQRQRAMKQQEKLKIKTESVNEPACQQQMPQQQNLKQPTSQQ